MPTKEPSKVSAVDRVRNSYKQLASASLGLNSASDEFNGAISGLDAALQRLNLGVAAWVELSANEDENGSWWSRELGYSRIGDTWRIGLRSQSGDHHWPDEDSVEQWAFDEAPRWMRIEAVSKIPDLLDALLKQTEDTTNKLKKRTGQVLELGVAMSEAVDQVEAGEQKRGDNA